MKKASYEKVGIYEQVEYACPQRWEPLVGDFRINAFGIHEMMPRVWIDRPVGTGDWLFMLFHDPALVMLQGEKRRVNSGSLLCWPHGAEHQYGHDSAEWDHTWIHFNGSWAAKILSECSVRFGEIIKLEQPASMETCLWRLYAELTNHQQPDHVILKNIFHNWLRELMRDDQEGASPFVPEKIRQIKQYLDQHIRQTITLPQLAEKAGISVPHLSAEFKRCYGNTPINYLIGLRLQQARYLLLNRNFSISEIARRVGYDDIYHFSKLFKKCFGHSPRAMRKQKLYGEEGVVHSEG